MSFPRYAEYKDSGVEWLGQVPAHWLPKRLSYLFGQISSGTTPPSDNPDNYGGDIFWVTTGELREEFIDATEKTVTAAALTKFSALKVYPAGTLLMAMYGATIGRLGILRVAASTNQACCAFAAPIDASVRFIFYCLLAARDHLILIASGGGQPNINQDKIRSLRVAKPPLSEQTAIAAFLDRETGKIDALVAEQEKLIALLKEKRQAVISHAVTQGLNPDAPMKPSGIEWLGDVPAHWDVIRIGAVFREAVDLGRDDLPILSVSIHDGVSDKELDADEMERKVTRSDDRSKYKAVCPGDLAYNMMRAWQGGFGAVKVEGQVSPAYVVARPTRDIRTSFVEQLLRTPQAVEQMRRHSRGITDFRLRLYWEEFKNIRVALPTVVEQESILAAIADQTDRFEVLTTEANRTITLLKERRSALISAAVTGQIDVRGLIPQTEAA